MRDSCVGCSESEMYLRVQKYHQFIWFETTAGWSKLYFRITYSTCKNLLHHNYDNLEHIVAEKKKRCKNKRLPAKMYIMTRFYCWKRTDCKMPATDERTDASTAKDQILILFLFTKKKIELEYEQHFFLHRILWLLLFLMRFQKAF